MAIARSIDPRFARAPTPPSPALRTGERVRRRLLSLILLLTLSACAPTLTAVRPAKLDQGDFFGTLAREQRRHAIFLGRQGVTIVEAERFARKAEAARAGQPLEPEPAKGPAMAAMRTRLLSLLATPAKERCPVFAALAFARYDAWAERQRAWPGSEETARYGRDTEENLAALAGPCSRTG
jgi:hypothetical protein